MGMEAELIREAASILAAAHRSGRHIEALPERCQPTTLGEAHAIQDELTRHLDERIAGWKVASAIDGIAMRGAIHASRVFDSPARIAAASMPLLGVEAEIAFVFQQDLPPRATPYTIDEVADAVSAFVAIEVVDSRFRNYVDTPLLHRAADCVSNGGLVRSEPRKDWRHFDLISRQVTLTIGGEVAVRQNGGHAAGDPLIPAVDLVNQLSANLGIRAGQFVTTGTYTGLNYAKPGQTVTVEFDDFGSAAVHFDL